MRSDYRNIFEPLTIRRMTMKNRIMMTPMGTNYGEQSGEMSFLHINYYEQRAKGGTGLIMVENASVDSPEGSNGTTQLQLTMIIICPVFSSLRKPYINTEPVSVSRSTTQELLRRQRAQACSRSLPPIFHPKQEEIFLVHSQRTKY